MNIYKKEIVKVEYLQFKIDLVGTFSRMKVEGLKEVKENKNKHYTAQTEERQFDIA